ncbi:hypothetical protein [Mycobacterium marseillense]|uniref:hypothetical protein n=1 Tax=Mycobacterium marseillense TaxID=701042 RepID=UPI0011A6447B|nr:hypothetical protein [Mycobacterium marseillense]
MAAGAAALALGLAYAAPAMADPPAPGPGFAQCGDQLVPLDPRVSVRDPLGTLIFQRLLEQMCPPHT